jgi:drug/metabolite transporter (DMT)-like permease
MKPISRGTALWLMIAAPFLWSTAGVVARHVQGATPFEMVFWRSLFALLFVFIAVLFVQKKNPVAAVRAAGRAGLRSGAMWAVAFTAFVIALTLTSIANTLVVMSISPLLTAIFSRFFLNDPLPTRTWIASVAVVVGIAWMFGSGMSAHSTRDIAGMLVALLVPIAQSANVVTLRGASARVDLIPAIMIGAALSCLVALPFVLPFSATPRDLGLLAFLGFFQLGLPCMLLVIASRSLLAPEMALLGLLEVVLGPLWAWIGAGEVPAQATLVGGAIVLGALVVNELTLLRPKLGRQP